VNRNVLSVGSSGCGKTTGELIQIIKAAEAEQRQAIVVIDPHEWSLAFGALTHLVARGHKRRILFERLSGLDPVLSWEWLRPSRATNENQRRAENELNVRAFTDLLMARRGNNAELAKSPLTEEWVMAALWLFVEQIEPRPLTALPFAFTPEHPLFRTLVENCRNAELGRKFAALENVRSLGLIAPARRLIEGVCSSPAFALRSGTASFDFAAFLDRGGILLVEGGGGISDDALRVMLKSIVIKTIGYVRHRRRYRLRVLLVLDEANNWDLVDDTHVGRALAECRKMGLDIHILVQSMNFPNSSVTDAVLTNCARHEWYYAANAAVARAAAADLGGHDENSQTEVQAKIRGLGVGQRYVKHHQNIFSETVKPLEDVWCFPGLADKKAHKALQQIRQRPEYRATEKQNDGDDAQSSPPDEPKPPENPLTPAQRL